MKKINKIIYYIKPRLDITNRYIIINWFGYELIINK